MLRKLFHKAYRFLNPDDKILRNRRLELLLWAFLLSLSYYPNYFGFLAWFALVRPIMILSSLRGREAFNAAFFYGFFFNLFSLYWVGIVTPPGMVSAVLIVGMYYAVALSLFVRLYHINKLLGYVILPFFWVGLEYFRTLSQFAFPWSDLGYSQSYYLYVMQIVSVLSNNGLSFLIVAVNVLLCQIARTELSPERRLTAGLSALTVVLAVVAYGWIVTPPIPVPGKIGVGLLQGSVPIGVKWDKNNKQLSLDLYDSLTQSIADSGCQLYIWPETSAPCYLSHNIWCSNRVASIVRKSNTFHLVGALGAKTGEADQIEHYNSCYQFSPDGTMGKRYDKVKLVPFAEQVPYQDNLPFLKAEFLKKFLTFIETYDVNWWSDFYPGDSARLFKLPDFYYAVLICFESTFPEYVRQNILSGSEFLVGITNDTWFGTSIGIHMHSRIFLTRCIENRCWGVRVANSGITYIVDGYGRIRDQLPVEEAAAMYGKVGEFRGYSAYTKSGNIIGWLSWLITLTVASILFFRWILQKTFLRRNQRS